MTNARHASYSFSDSSFIFLTSAAASSFSRSVRIFFSASTAATSIASAFFGAFMILSSSLWFGSPMRSLFRVALASKLFCIDWRMRSVILATSRVSSAHCESERKVVRSCSASGFWALGSSFSDFSDILGVCTCSMEEAWKLIRCSYLSALEGIQCLARKICFARRAMAESQFPNSMTMMCGCARF